jgi:GNAT superfamily N-acetyltransferase
MRIRAARIEDADALTRIAHVAKASWGYPDAWLIEWAPILTITANYLRAHRVLVAEEGESLGFGALELGPSGPEVGHLWVLPDAQGRGVGRALVRRLLRDARRLGWESVRVESDPHARPFYERMGGIWVGNVPAPVAGVDRHLPVLQLPA